MRVTASGSSIRQIERLCTPQRRIDVNTYKSRIESSQSHQSGWFCTRESKGSVQRPKCVAGGCICTLSKDEELSLAHERSAFSRLSSAARRARRSDFCH